MLCSPVAGSKHHDIGPVSWIKLAEILSGSRKMTREILQKTYVERLVVGPEDHFGATIVQEELDADATRFLWAVLITEDNRIDVGQLLNHLQVEQPDQIVVGRVSQTLPIDLVNAKAWTKPAFMKFNQDVEEGVHVDWAQPMLLQKQGSCVCDVEKHTEPFALAISHIPHDMGHGCPQVRAIGKGKYATLQQGFRYLPDDKSFALMVSFFL